MKRKYSILLKKTEIKKLNKILHTGKHLARVRNRAQALLLSNQNMEDKIISAVVGVTLLTVFNTRKRYCQEGLEATLYDKPRAGRPKDFDTTDEAELTALACSDPPQGCARWTLELLKKGMKKEIGKSTVHLMLKKTNVNLGSRKCGVSEK